MEPTMIETDDSYRDRICDAMPEGHVHMAESLSNAYGEELDAIGDIYRVKRQTFDVEATDDGNEIELLKARIVEFREFTREVVDTLSYEDVHDHQLDALRDAGKQLLGKQIVHQAADIEAAKTLLRFLSTRYENHVDGEIRSDLEKVLGLLESRS